MKEISNNIPEVENVIKKALPKIPKDGGASVTIGTLNINNNTPGTSVSVGGRVRKSHIPSWIVFSIIALIPLCILLFIYFALASQKIISRDMASSIAADVAIVAECEGKTTQKVYRELSAKHGYKKYKSMPLNKYDDVKKELEERKCDIVIP